MFPEASSDSRHPSSEAPSASPPPSRRTFEASRPSATITAPLLVVDPNVVIPPFKKDSVLRRFEAGRKQDLEEEEGVSPPPLAGAPRETSVLTRGGESPAGRIRAAHEGLYALDVCESSG